MPCALLAVLCLIVATAKAADYAGANSTSNDFSRTEEPLVTALVVTGPSIPGSAPPAAATAPVISPSFTPAPAQFFTINEVMAKRNGRAVSGPSLQLASINPAQTPTDTGSYATSRSSRSNEPFGLSMFVAPDGVLWSKWRKLEAEMRAEEPTLARCLADQKQCSPAAARFSAIVNDARERKGRNKFELVNERINDAIRYTDDFAQWGVADVWSAPLVTFASGRGDCEDYAIAKYVALRESGISTDDLRVLLVRDNAVRIDHAVLAVRHDGRWLILDNRVPQLLLTEDLPHFLPLFALDQHGVSLFAAPFAARPLPNDQHDAAPAANGQDFTAANDLVGGGLSIAPLLL